MFMSILINSATGGLKSIDDWSCIACVDDAGDRSRETLIPAPMDIDAIRPSMVILLWSIVAISFTFGIELCHHLWTKNKLSRCLKSRNKVN